MHLDQQRRYARQIMLSEIGEAGQQKLLDARVLVIGAGGLGSALISYLAAAGVGHIGIIDDDRVELSNLARQIIHETGDIGRLKVESASDRVAEINPGVEVVTYAHALTEANAVEIIGGRTDDAGARREAATALPLRGRVGVGPSADLAAHNGPRPTSPLEGEALALSRFRPSALGASLGYDVVADGCDNFLTRFVVNRVCIQLKKPLVSAAIAGWAGQVMSVAPHLLADSGCYQCLVSPEAPEMNTCKESGIVGPLAGVIGSMQALEVVNMVLGQPALLGKLAVYDAKAMSQRISALPKDVHCPVCGA